MLLHLARIDLANHHQGAKISSRDLAIATNTSRSNVQPAIDSLTARGLIATRQGHATKAAAYVVRFLDIAQMSGPVLGPPPQATGLLTGPPLALIQGHPGPITGPLDAANKGTPSALDLTTDSIERLDRALSAKSRTKNRSELDDWCARIELHSAHLGAPHWRPDPEGTAQIMEACLNQPGALEHLFTELRLDRIRASPSAGWWVTVALQRIQHFSKDDVATRRAELKAARKPRLLKSAEETTPAETRNDLTAEIEKLRQNTAMNPRLKKVEERDRQNRRMHHAENR